MGKYAWTFQGFAVLIGFNFLLIETPIIAAMLGGQSGKSLESWSILVYSLAFCVAQVVNIFGSHLAEESARIIVGLVSACLALFVIPLAVLIPISELAVAVCFVCTAIYGFGSSLFQSTLFGIASRSENIAYMGKFSFGHSLAGIPCWPLQLLARACMIGSKVEVFLTIILAAILTSFSSYILKRYISTQASTCPEQEVVMPVLRLVGPHSFDGCDDSPRPAACTQLVASDLCRSPENDPKYEEPGLFRGVAMHAFNLWCTCLVAYACFPTEVYSWSHNWDHQTFAFVSVFVFLYQLSDCCFRYIVDLIPRIPSKRMILVFNIVRLLIAASGFYLTHADTLGLSHWSFRALLIVFHSACSACIITWSLIIGPEEFTEPDTKTKAGYILGLAIVLGDICGSTLGGIIKETTT